MKYPGGNTSTLFCEQVGTVTSLFEQWNDCERTVVLYALLKRVPFANLKFLQLSIEYNIAQSYNSQTKLHVLETNSNNAAFLTKLINAYKNFKCNEAQLSKESIIYETGQNNSQHFLDSFGKYDKKEDILNDILTYLPLLKPGNEDAKAVFLSLIPCAVDDSVRQIVPIELVQQILSYLLIHPAISNEDRRSLSQWLRHLGEHMSSSYVQNKAPNYFLIPSETSSPSSSISSQWQAVAPPLQSQKITHDNSWDLKSIQVTQEYCDEIQMKDFRKTVGKSIEFAAVGNGSVTKSSNSSNLLFDSSNDDHHVSFSKNGTEILDYDCDDYNKSNTQIAYDPTASLHDFLTVPSFHENNALKTRRSNSLTTTTTTSQNVISSSSENLASILQKPRSFSLSMESPRSSLTSSGSETRLDDYKPNHMKFSSLNAGMGNIGQWLKSLRLHKYIWLFTNITYEQMLEINETYLESVGVTKGARNKLVLCIQKLKERTKILSQYKKEILSGQCSLNTILEELTNMVITPMKPVDPYSKDDVAGIMLQIIDIVAKILTSRPITSQSDEDCVTNFMTILERAIHNEGFTASSDVNIIKEHKFKISKIKLQFTPKNHYSKSGSGNGSGINKPRWNSNSSKQHKSQSSEKSQRKNSNFSINISQQTHLQQYHDNLKAFYPPLSTNYNKSSSYPNFNSSSSSSSNSSSKSKTLQQHSNNSSTYHRHSLNNLITTGSGGGGQSGLPTTTSHSTSQIGNSNCTTNNNNNSIGNKENRNNKDVHHGTQNYENVTETNNRQNRSQKTSIGDINSRLEFLCLQMTEQAIN